MSATLLAGYLLAVAATAAAALLRGLLSHWIGFDLPYITFFGAVMVAAWYGGWRPGMLATGLSAAASAYWFIVPVGQMILGRAADVVGMLLFVLIGTLISAASEQLHRARRHIEEQNRVLADAARARAEAERGISSERRLADQAQALLAAVVESSDDAILTKTLDGRILSWNAGAEQMFGYPPPMSSARRSDAWCPPAAQTEEADLLRARQPGRAGASRSRPSGWPANGAVLDVSVTLSPIRDDGGRIIGASSIARDIRRTQGARRRRCARPTGARTTSWRCSRTSCAIRWRRSATASPCCGWRASTTSIRPRRRRDRSADRSTWPACSTTCSTCRGSPAAGSNCAASGRRCASVLDAALETTRPLLDGPGQSVTVALPDEPIYLDGDPVRLAQVFANLLSNAAKYSDSRRQGAV